MAGFGGLFERCGTFLFLNFTHRQLKERKFHTLSFTSSAHLRNSKPEGGAQTLRCVSKRLDSLTYRQLKFNLLPQYLPLKTYHFRTVELGVLDWGLQGEEKQILIPKNCAVLEVRDTDVYIYIYSSLSVHLTHEIIVQIYTPSSMIRLALVPVISQRAKRALCNRQSCISTGTTLIPVIIDSET